MQYVKGWGKLKSPTEVEVTGLDGTVSVISTKSTIIATGSEVTPLPGLTIDEKRCAPEASTPWTLGHKAAAPEAPTPWTLGRRPAGDP